MSVPKILKWLKNFELADGIGINLLENVKEVLSHHPLKIKKTSFMYKDEKFIGQEIAITHQCAGMAILVVEFSNGGYKLRNSFA